MFTKLVLSNMYFTSIKPVLCRNDNEDSAKVYGTKYVTVTDNSMWLDKSGFLEDNPDELLKNDTITDTKCVYKLNDYGTMSMQRKTDYQVQFTSQIWNYFLMWTLMEYETLILEPDEDWPNSGNILTDFHKYSNFCCIFLYLIKRKTRSAT